MTSGMDAVTWAAAVQALIASRRSSAFRAATSRALRQVTALDPGHRLDAMVLLHAVSRAGVGMAVVLHDLTLAARYCDRVIVLDGGRVAAEGPPGAILTDARADIEGSPPVLPGWQSRFDISSRLRRRRG